MNGLYYFCLCCNASTPAAIFNILSSLKGTPRISSPTGSSGSSGYSSSFALPIGTDSAVYSSYDTITVFGASVLRCELSKESQLPTPQPVIPRFNLRHSKHPLRLRRELLTRRIHNRIKPIHNPLELTDFC